MEASVRSRSLIAALLALTACSERQTPEPVEPPAPPDRRPADAVLIAVVGRSHGTRKGTFDRVAVEVREQPDGTPTTIAAHLPDSMRATDPTGSTALVLAEGAWRWRSNEAVEELVGESREATDRLRIALDMICLQPLLRSERAERVGADRVAFHADGRRYELAYDPATDEPRSLAASDARIDFVDIYDSGVTRIPILVDVEGLGRRHIRFLDTGVPFDPGTFVAPSGERPSPPSIVLGPTSPSAVARVEATRAVSWLMVPDPGAWDERLEIYRAAGRRLGPAGYTNGGDPMILTEEGRAWFVIPFLPARDDPAPVEPDGGERLREIGAGRAVLVDAVDGEFDHRVVSATATLDAFIAEHQLQVSGPALVAINLLGRDPATDPSCLRSAPLRVSFRLDR